MKESTTHIRMSSLFFWVLLSTAPTWCVSVFWEDAPSSEELVAVYPALASDRPGNSFILCPFLRLLERSGRLDGVVLEDVNTTTTAAAAAAAETQEPTLQIPTRDLKQAAFDFGCDTFTGCGPVIDSVSSRQREQQSKENNVQVSRWSWLTRPFRQSNEELPPFVDLERLWDAPPISHDCGFTFEPTDAAAESKSVSDARLERTLSQLAARAEENKDGTLVYQDILQTKQDICDEESVNMSSAGLIETQLIFAYLGGVERGFVDYADVERFLKVDNEMPLTKAQKPISAFYLLQVND